MVQCCVSSCAHSGCISFAGVVFTGDSHVMCAVVWMARLCPLLFTSRVSAELLSFSSLQAQDRQTSPLTHNSTHTHHTELFCCLYDWTLGTKADLQLWTVQSSHLWATSSRVFLCFCKPIQSAIEKKEAKANTLFQRVFKVTLFTFCIKFYFCLSLSCTAARSPPLPPPPLLLRSLSP